VSRVRDQKAQYFDLNQWCVGHQVWWMGDSGSLKWLISWESSKIIFVSSSDLTEEFSITYFFTTKA